MLFLLNANHSHHEMALPLPLPCFSKWMATTRWHDAWAVKSFGAQERPNRKSSPVRTSDRLSSTFGDVEPKVSQMESFQGQDIVPECDQEWVLHTKWLWRAPFFTERKIAGKTMGPQPLVGRRNDIPSTDEHKKCEKSCSPGAKNARPFHTPIETSPGVKNAQPFSAPIENRQLLLPGMKPSA